MKMEESLKTNSLTFQFISWYDQTIFDFVERVTQHQETQFTLFLKNQ